MKRRKSGVKRYSDEDKRRLMNYAAILLDLRMTADACGDRRSLVAIAAQFESTLDATESQRPKGKVK